MRSTIGLTALIILATTCGLPLPSFADPLQLTSPVSTYIDEYCKCEVNPHIYSCGQGHTADGKPNYAADGSAPGFAGGAAGDIWKPMGEPRKFSNGAVGRTLLWVWANCDVRVTVANHELDLVDAAGNHVPATGWIGRLHCEDWSIWIRDEWENLRPICCLGLLMYIYCCAERQGLSDHAGTYTGTITIELTPM